MEFEFFGCATRARFCFCDSGRVFCLRDHEHSVGAGDVSCVAHHLQGAGKRGEKTKQSNSVGREIANRRRSFFFCAAGQTVVHVARSFLFRSDLRTGSRYLVSFSLCFVSLVFTLVIFSRDLTLLILSKTLLTLDIVCVLSLWKKCVGFGLVLKSISLAEVSITFVSLFCSGKSSTNTTTKVSSFAATSLQSVDHVKYEQFQVYRLPVR